MIVDLGGGVDGGGEEESEEGEGEERRRLEGRRERGEEGLARGRGEEGGKAGTIFKFISHSLSCYAWVLVIAHGNTRRVKIGTLRSVIWN